MICDRFHLIEKDEQTRVFQQLAIRRNKNRDRIYFFEFFHKTADLKCESKKHQVFGLDITQIDYPLHFIFKTIEQSIVNSDKNITKMISNMHKLFHFCDGLRIDTQMDETLDEHVFYAVLDALYSIDTLASNEFVLRKQRTKLKHKTIWFFFMKLLQKPEFTARFYLQRNKIFHDQSGSAQNKLKKAKEFILKLGRESFEEGVNIFEYCFFYREEEKEHNKCREFVYLFDAFLKAVHLDNHISLDANFLSELISGNEGDLQILFRETNGFHIEDEHGQTPLFYACQDGLDDVIQFFAKHVMKDQLNDLSLMNLNNLSEQKDEEIKDKMAWIWDQTYLHNLLDALFVTTAMNPNPKSFVLLLSTGKISVNYNCPKQGHLGHHLVHIKNSDYAHKGYIMKCIQILKKFEYDFVGNKDEKGNNILHKAVLCGDIVIIDLVLHIYRESNESLKQMLNAKNADGRMPFHVAMDLCFSEMAEVFLECSEQYIDFEPFLHKTGSIDSQWIKCFAQLLTKNESKDKLSLSLYADFMQNLKYEEGQKLLNHANIIFKKMDPNRKSTRERYQNLNKIINFLYNRLGIKRPEQTGFFAMAKQVGMAAHGKKEFMNPLQLTQAVSTQNGTSVDLEDMMMN